MSSTSVIDQRHYVNLPMCGFCVNAWDVIYMRARPGTISPQRWIEFCHHGGCDPDVWDYIDQETEWPPGFVFLESGHVDWPETVEAYVVPDHDDRVFHMRLSEGPGAAWRKIMPKLAATFSATRGAGRYENGTVKDEDIQWDEPDEPEPEDDGIQEDVSDAGDEFVDDDDIEW